MLSRAIAIGTIAASLGLTGCGGKAEISADCSLSGSGDYQCKFNNTGNAEGSSCVYLTLGATQEYPGASWFSDAGHTVSFNFGVMAFTLEELKNGRTPNIANYHSDANPSRIFSKQQLIEYGKGQFQESKLSLDDYVIKNYDSLSLLAVKISDKGLSNKICSGLVRAGDIKDVNGFASFSSTLAKNLPPQKACDTLEGFKHIQYSWTDVCEFSIILENDLNNIVKVLAKDFLTEQPPSQK